MYDFQVNDLTKPINVCVVFACAVLMMIFREIKLMEP